MTPQGQQCLQHTGLCEQVSNLGEKVAKLDATSEGHEGRIVALETENQVRRASLSRFDRILVVVVPCLASLASILFKVWQSKPH